MPGEKPEGRGIGEGGGAAVLVYEPGQRESPHDPELAETHEPDEVEAELEAEHRTLVTPVHPLALEPRCDEPRAHPGPQSEADHEEEPAAQRPEEAAPALAEELAEPPATVSEPDARQDSPREEGPGLPLRAYNLSARGQGWQADDHLIPL